MKRLSLGAVVISIAVAAGMLLSGCGVLVKTRDTGPTATMEAGPTATRAFEFSDFDAVEIGNAFEFDIAFSDAYGVEITANEGLLDGVSVRKDGKTLKIGMDWPVVLVFGGSTPEARITMPELVALKVSGASVGTAKGFKSARDLRIDVSGSSTLELDAETGKLTGEISGASRVTATNKGTAASLELSGSSNVRLNMETGELVYSSSGASQGSGDVKAASTKMTLTGSSMVSLTGTGGDLELSGSGASVARLEGFVVANADIDLGGSTRADVDVNGAMDMTLSGASVLRYQGNPTLGERMNIGGGSRFERR